MSRKLKRDWITEYIQYVTDATESPLRFHWWSAATAISATLKRSVWIDRKLWKLYPNLYVVLVGRPGLGKGAAMHPALNLMKQAGTVNVLSDRITMEYVLEKLSKGFPRMHQSNNGQGTLRLGTESAALLVSSELSVFITASQFSITALSDLWDSKEGLYQYGTRGKGEYNIQSPCVSLFGGSAQEWLIKSIPADAVGGGFTRRVNFVLATKKDKKVPWPKAYISGPDDLIEDLRSISTLHGEFTFSGGARKLFERYYNSCEPNDFDDEATCVYKTSKWANASKLAQVISVARGDSLEINELDLMMAIQKIDEVVEDLKMVFRSVGESTLASASEKVLRFIETKGYASRSDILARNWRHMTSGDLDIIIATFREAGTLGERTVGNQTLYFVK